ncbi:Mu-like prophage major head subunit gpT family protein [Aeromonas salmonicida]|uniref:Mu-like prophage major head subunit gpT family protein n=1 Tax=Aeromonas salmonicida TaxID=645 RepID=UPI00259F2588|nr:Mu-like prophage major head subunit gpT family protein [Aeromonas salmonicida]MDM5062623.1 Mu-like prophage major head subunit gpT family protein [Aeromonas salmonicida]
MAFDPTAIVVESSTAFAARFSGGWESAKPDYRLVSTVIQSSAGATGYGWLGDFPRLKEWIGDRQLKQLSKLGYSIVNKTFEASVAIKRTDYEDNDYGRYGIIFEQMGYDAAMYPDEHVFTLLKNGFTELCYDGQPFFDVDHPLETTPATTASNIVGDPAGTGSPWFLLDTSKPIKPLIWQERVAPEFSQLTDPNTDVVFLKDEYYFGTRARGNAGYSFWQMAVGCKVALDEANFEAAVSSMMNLKDSEGRSLKVRPTLLVVDVTNKAAAEKILNRKTLDNGEDNTNYKMVELLVNQDL